MRPTKKQQQGERSRELILDATEQLMATRGYAATSISDIRKACGLPPSSIYWHFGSKEGVLAAVMQRGADRFFAAIPTSEDAETQLAVLSTLQAQHPDFLRLFYMLSLERGNDPAVPRWCAVSATPQSRGSAARSPSCCPPTRRRRRPTVSSPNSPRSPSHSRTGCSSPTTSNPIPTSSECTGGCHRPLPR
jgi:AcrR family transcriptional regulator